jgi:putative ABC transport system ATP-binding protein
MPDKTVIELENIRKVYTMGESRVLALNGVNLTVFHGEMVAVMGSSGSGKSTLLNIIGCLDKPTEGTYVLDGENVSTLDKNQLAAIRNKKLALCFRALTCWVESR